jgi:hypothetical protein
MIFQANKKTRQGFLFAFQHAMSNIENGVASDGISTMSVATAFRGLGHSRRGSDGF